MGGVNPIFGNPGVKIIPKADFVFFPGQVSLAVDVNAVPFYDPYRVAGQIVVNINHIRHQVFRKVFEHGRMFAHQLPAQLFDDPLFIGGKLAVNFLFNIGRVVFGHGPQREHIIVD